MLILLGLIQFASVLFSLFGPHYLYSVHIDPILSILLLFGPFCLLWSYSVYSVHFGSIWSILSTLVHFSPIRAIRYTLILFGSF